MELGDSAGVLDDEMPVVEKCRKKTFYFGRYVLDLRQVHFGYRAREQSVLVDVEQAVIRDNEKVEVEARER
jgi:hypothetical protein